MRLLNRLAVATLLPLTSCAIGPSSPGDTGFGASPAIPAPQSTLIPMVNIAPVQTRPAGFVPTAPPSFDVTEFARGLAHPRWLYTLPNGDVLVAESDAPEEHDEGSGLFGWVRKQVMKRAGAGVPSPDRIVLLRDVDGSGVARNRTLFLGGLHSPFGMALIGNQLYVADTDALLRFNYVPGSTQITSPGVKVVDLPGGPINHHWTKNILADRSGRHLYITVGSNSNAGENGVDAEQGRARILVLDIDTGHLRPYATGLRNANGLAWQPDSGALWTAVNERDDLGNNLVPDYMTAVKDGAFYGFPYSYYGQHIDTRVKPQRPDLVATAIVPDYALGNHTASLGLVFYDRALFPPHYRGGAFVGQHGSWNRKPRTGYKVVFVPFVDGKPAGVPEDFLSGFLTPDGYAVGRPVGVALDAHGALLVADDIGNAVWRVAPHKNVKSADIAPASK
ncbi:NHL repeat family protein (plasmid) [Paraburkholderia fungorum]|jgi:glucose/arabinose dehydrogenase|uniref:NHL repeat family protein n=1 Tax=Paraburkholderia fungorum TaxID=134537 RepID=A0AAU8STM5_9BURK|nr:sorbosone dehydrogenase family protein [Paraburkholderia fungorum]AJZ56284.1 NHL repeat family protein [Paraburkholderia fungorum]MBB5545058.1 glucose/arabinose dehydrogenase [Paraburkholderia fungorum]MBU7442431.1 sorbosone dehydrogenase family protein [Paraburkholderia fungorum]MDE1008839.1 sorbosone dehydrogenase family protein [Paraburkholderia fungorum]PNE59221.1 sorbosone dehydrogenase [Paraburkholderia fungorum]